MTMYCSGIVYEQIQNRGDKDKVLICHRGTKAHDAVSHEIYGPCDQVTDEIGPFRRRRKLFKSY